MLFGRRSPAMLEPVYVFLEFGQSNAHGPLYINGRFENAYNYKGISTGYPAARVAQEQYVRTPANVLTYYKDTLQSGDQTTDNGVWEAYNAGVNSSKKTAAGTQYVGTELSCAVRLQEYTGKTVCIIKAAFGTTAISSTATGSIAPGNWNTGSRTVAVEYYLNRGIRDLKLLYPNRRIRVVAVNCWGGEQDAVSGISKAVFKSEFLSLKTYVNAAISSLVVIEKGKDPIWNVTSLNFARSANEVVINSAYTELATENSDIYLIDSAPYPQLDELSIAEASPVAVGSPNSEGGVDDNHSSRIAMLSVGELQGDNIIAHHGI